MTSTDARRVGTGRRSGEGLTSTLSPWGPLPLRLMLGFGFLYHGAPKVFTRSGNEEFAGMLQGLGVPWPEVAAWGVGLVEVIGGAALIVGALTWIFAVLLICDMVVAALLVHLPHGFNTINIVGMTAQGPEYGMPGYEFNLLYIAGLFSLLLTGPGAWAVDTWWLARGSRNLDEGAAVSG